MGWRGVEGFDWILDFWIWVEVWVIECVDNEICEVLVEFLGVL